MSDKYLDSSNRTKSDGDILLSQKTWEQTHLQGTCEYISGQCDFIVQCKESAQAIQIGDLSCSGEDGPENL
jgi:hypothetical protein